jgi:hypothetical protein
MVQRMGRTGRKRDGRVVQLVSEGTEHNRYKKNNNNQSRVHKVRRWFAITSLSPAFSTGHYCWRQEAQISPRESQDAAAWSPALCELGKVTALAMSHASSASPCLLSKVKRMKLLPASRRATAASSKRDRAAEDRKSKDAWALTTLEQQFYDAQ